MNQYEEFISNIIEYIVEHYNIPEYKAQQIVEEITENSLFHDHADMVMHDGVECWAYIIFKTYNKTMSRKLVKQFLYDTGRTDYEVCYEIQDFRNYFEHFGENNLKLFISRLIRDNFLEEDNLKAGYSFEDALEFIDWFCKILEGVEIK